LAESIVVCEHCDLVVRKTEDPARGYLVCPRCGGLLDHGRAAPPADPLPLALASLVLLLLANLQPIVSLDLRGSVVSTTLWNAIVVLFGEDRPVVAGMVLATTIVAPAAELLAICYVLLPLRVGFLPPGLPQVVRAIQTVRPWGMIEVFVLGTLVALVKLAHVASVVPGAGLWSFGALILLMAGCAATFEPARAWRRAFAIDRLAGHRRDRLPGAAAE